MTLRWLIMNRYVFTTITAITSTGNQFDNDQFQIDARITAVNSPMSQRSGSSQVTPSSNIDGTVGIIVLCLVDTIQKANFNSKIYCFSYPSKKYRLDILNVSYSYQMKYDICKAYIGCYHIELASNRANGTWEELSCFRVEDDHKSEVLRILMISENGTKSKLLQLGIFKLALSGVDSLTVNRGSVATAVHAKEFSIDTECRCIIPKIQGKVRYNMTVRLNRCQGSFLTNWTWCTCCKNREASATSANDVPLWHLPLRMPMKAPEQFVNMTMVSVIAEIQENPVIVTAFALAYLTFVIAFILAFRKDSEDRDKPPYIEMYDNFPDEKYRYLIIIHTGNRKRAGPTSTVAIQIIGRKSSKVHLLQEHGYELFLVQGTVATFVLRTKSCVGDVKKIRLWHHNEGISPEWYVERVVVQDYETKEAWLFPINSWLSDHQAGKAKLDITVPAASWEELNTFRSLFAIKSGKYLKERHMWYSSFVKHPWSMPGMTRLHHLGCCMLLVFMIMVTAVAFYGAQGSPVLDLGFYSFQWLNIAIGDVL